MEEPTKKAPKGAVIYETTVTHGNDDDKKYLTPIKAIRAKCLDCCCDSWLEVKLCTSKKCALYPYRLGKRPRRNVADGREIAEQTPVVPDSTEIRA